MEAALSIEDTQRRTMPALVALAGSETIGRLLTELPALSPSTTCEAVVDYFAAHPRAHSVAVVDEGRPIGLVNRHRVTDQFSRRFFRELYGRKTVTALMERDPLIVDEGMAIDDVARVIVDDEDRYLYEGFIITRDGLYRGMGTGRALLREVSERKQAYLHHIAYHDVLTGLPNRQLFYDRLGQALREAQRGSHHVAVFYLDLDHFKAVNDTLGHAAGDQLLLEASQRLRACLREADTLARLGGDEFAVVLDRLTRDEDAALVAERMRAAAAAPFQIEARRVEISASIGISFFPADGETIQDLVRHADCAVYHSKKDRNRFSFYARSMGDAPPKK
jgi:diguanylate cyclase (GGDEF)-like protein